MTHIVLSAWAVGSILSAGAVLADAHEREVELDRFDLFCIWGLSLLLGPIGLAMSFFMFDHWRAGFRWRSPRQKLEMTQQPIGFLPPGSKAKEAEACSSIGNP